MSSETARIVAAGADGCEAGWVVAYKSKSSCGLRLEPNFSCLLKWWTNHGRPPLGVDVPIGMSWEGGDRDCDKQARQELTGKRKSSVFPPPGRYLLPLADKPYDEIRAETNRRKAAGENVAGINSQTAGLLRKIDEVDKVLAEGENRHELIFEVHPEVCFARWASEPPSSKRSPAGEILRLMLVKDEFGPLAPLLDDEDWETSDADLTDVLDAFAALRTALHWPDEVDELGGGQPDAEGFPQRIVVYPRRRAD